LADFLAVVVDLVAAEVDLAVLVAEALAVADLAGVGRVCK
jgi:hypothetical protein